MIEIISDVCKCKAFILSTNDYALLKQTQSNALTHYKSITTQRVALSAPSIACAAVDIGFKITVALRIDRVNHASQPNA